MSTIVTLKTTAGVCNYADAKRCHWYVSCIYAGLVKLVYLVGPSYTMGPMKLRLAYGLIRPDTTDI